MNYSLYTYGLNAGLGFCTAVLISIALIILIAKMLPSIKPKAEHYEFDNDTNTVMHNGKVYPAKFVALDKEKGSPKASYLLTSVAGGITVKVTFSIPVEEHSTTQS